MSAASDGPIAIRIATTMGSRGRLTEADQRQPATVCTLWSPKASLMRPSNDIDDRGRKEMAFGWGVPLHEVAEIDARRAGGTR